MGARGFREAESPRAVAVFVVAALCAAWGTAHAATFSLAIGATVLSKNNCRFQSAAGAVLNFGALDPSSGTNATASTTLVIRCTGSSATASYTITPNDGLHASGPGQPRLQHTTATTNFMPYTIAPVSGTTPKNTNTNVSITGTITVANFQNALGGAYADTVTLTLQP